MCDTLVAGPWFAKNSDREPSEPQVIEIHPRAAHDAARLKCTYLEIPQVAHTHGVIISRPIWMWGCEMGVNERGVAIGNEAVFTNVKVAATGLTGMDLVRLGLERGASAAEALDVITNLLETHGQGGPGGYRNKSFAYHNSFIIADPDEAFVLETAGRHWASECVEGPRTISNALSIPDFADEFADPIYRVLAGGEQRAACTLGVLQTADVIDGTTMRRALRDHGTSGPVGGWRSSSPCAHASWLPTRHAAQTTGSLIAHLDHEETRVWATGTSSPCLSVFKRVPFDPTFDLGPAPGRKADESLWWRHERLHRAVLGDYDGLAPTFADARALFEARVFSAEPDASHWTTHRRLVGDWLERVEPPARRSGVANRLWWAIQDRRDGLGR